MRVSFQEKLQSAIEALMTVFHLQIFQVGECGQMEPVSGTHFATDKLDLLIAVTAYDNFKVHSHRSLPSVWHLSRTDHQQNPYKPVLLLFRFFRTYSARIYFIETNSSLACLHVPHPSIPVDDISAHSFDREYGLRLRGSRGCLGLCIVGLLAAW